MKEFPVKMIISGGQTGADQGALDCAHDLGIPHGGWVPKGRKTESGPLAEKYSMWEMPTTSYAARTEKNVLDSDGTLILTQGKLSGGSALTVSLAQQHQRPFLHIDLASERIDVAARNVRHWLKKNAVEKVNVAGPRASQAPQIYELTMRVLQAALTAGNDF